MKVLVRVFVLGSGSTGNALLVESCGTKVMIEAGVGPRIVGSRLAELGMDGAGAVPPTPLGGAPGEALRAVIAGRGLPLVELVSGAGHDAGVLAQAGVPSV